MSKWSGKCDFYDSFVLIHKYTFDEIKNNTKIYLGNSDTPLVFEKEEDLIPYYSHLIAVGAFNTKERTATIRLSSKPYPDIEESRLLEFYLSQTLKIYNRCKRKKIDFVTEDVIKELCYNGWNKEIYTELAKRVKESGRKATSDGIHLKMYERYRKELVEEMLKHGLNPLEYGDYERFLTKENTYE